ncbi:MAG: hypothetical protein CBC13_01580 [Planctomycetia bacterium TMED53]|nr:MAG: hypothetical protein CBC13_01580 [Planctomycetia bacterium TMED53]
MGDSPPWVFLQCEKETLGCEVVMTIFKEDQGQCFPGCTTTGALFQNQGQAPSRLDGIPLRLLLKRLLKQTTRLAITAYQSKGIPKELISLDLYALTLINIQHLQTGTFPILKCRSICPHDEHVCPWPCEWLPDWYESIQAIPRYLPTIRRVRQAIEVNRDHKYNQADENRPGH